MIAQQFIDDGYPVSNVLKTLRLPRSSYYYTSAGTAGRGVKLAPILLPRMGTM